MRRQIAYEISSLEWELVHHRNWGTIQSHLDVNFQWWRTSIKNSCLFCCRWFICFGGREFFSFFEKGAIQSTLNSTFILFDHLFTFFQELFAEFTIAIEISYISQNIEESYTPPLQDTLQNHPRHYQSIHLHIPFRLINEYKSIKLQSSTTNWPFRVRSATMLLYSSSETISYTSGI